MKTRPENTLTSYIAQHDGVMGACTEHALFIFYTTALYLVVGFLCAAVLFFTIFIVALSLFLVKIRKIKR